MASADGLGILPQIESLVSDHLQVVSYKWLSRNFSVPSNQAKRLLKEFAETRSSNLEVVYTISGWLKENPQSYCVRLASGSKLGVVKQEFDDNCSVQVYSVQACIPEDITLLWNTEFLQAEELFNQTSNTDNCLRDNRFCGVTNSFVKRNASDGNAGSILLQSRAGMQTDIQSKTAPVLKTSPFQGQLAELSGKHGIPPSSSVTKADKSDETNQEITDKTSNPNAPRETKPDNTSKRKGQSERASSGNGGSLANTWGRASVKSKPASPALDVTTAIPYAAASGEAQVRANEAACADKNEDHEQNIGYRRESNGGRSRKRKAIIYFSDDDGEEEHVVSLASPDSSDGNPVFDNADTTKSVSEVKKDSKVEAGTMDAKQDSSMENDKSVSSALSKPGKRKVLKTRIDERGREVNEVVWEGEAAQNVATNAIEDRLPVANKVPTSRNTAPANSISKAGTKKTTKGVSKDAKQGNILSFFKKI